MGREDQRLRAELAKSSLGDDAVVEIILTASFSVCVSLVLSGLRIELEADLSLPHPDTEPHPDTDPKESTRA